MERNLFEIAAKKAFRFASQQGLLTTEDLFSLPLINLNKIGVALIKQIKDSTEESLIAVPTSANQELQDKLDIIKHIIAIKQAELEAQKTAKDKAEKRGLLRQALFDAQNKELASKTPQEIEAMLKELE